MPPLSFPTSLEGVPVRGWPVVVEGAGGNLHPPPCLSAAVFSLWDASCPFPWGRSPVPSEGGGRIPPTQHPVAVKAKEVSLEKLPALCVWK